MSAGGAALAPPSRFNEDLFHVRKGGGKAKLWISPVELVYARGFTKPEERRVRELTQEHAAYFLQRWAEYFHR